MKRSPFTPRGQGPDCDAVLVAAYCCPPSHRGEFWESYVRTLDWAFQRRLTVRPAQPPPYLRDFRTAGKALLWPGRWWSGCNGPSGFGLSGTV